MQHTESLQQPRAALLAARGQQQMNVVRHQAVSVDIAGLRSRQPPQVMEIKRTVLIIGKARSTIVPPLYGMNGDTGNNISTVSWHIQSTMLSFSS